MLKKLEREEIRKEEGGDYNLSDLYTRKIEIIKEIKNIEYNDLEDMVFRMELIFDKILNSLDVKSIA